MPPWSGWWIESPSAPCPPVPVMSEPAAKTRGPGIRFSATHCFRMKGTVPAEPVSRMEVMPEARKTSSRSRARSVWCAGSMASDCGTPGSG